MSRDHAEIRPTFENRLVAECVRRLERDGRQPIEDSAAVDAARNIDGDLEVRIITRARSLSIADELRGAIHQFRAGVTWIIVIGLLLALVLGAATARTTMGDADETRVNFYWILGGVLGVQSILLLIWVVAAVSWRVRIHRSSNEQTESPMLISLGRLVVAAGQWLGTKLHASGRAGTVIPAATGVFTTGRIGFWTFSSITHAIWLMFNVGAMTLILLLLAARQYTFVWETTILSERHYVSMTEALSAPARAAGFAVPTDEDIALSQWTGEPVAMRPPEGASHRWASLLIASIVFYGFGPRLLLLGVSLSMRRLACRAYRLDTSMPGYERWRTRLMPTSRSLGVVDADDGSSDDDVTQRSESAGQQRDSARPPGPPVIVGLEIAPPETGWPPGVNGVAWRDFGIIESRGDRTRIAESLRTSETEPHPLVIVADLTNTPDRGLGRALSALAESVNAQPLLVLSAGQKLRERGYDADGIAQRLADWRALAERAGLDRSHVIEVDLDHLTDAAAAQLAKHIGREDGHHTSAPPVRQLETAFSIIEQHARPWLERNAPPSESEQFSLHQKIAGLYRSQSGSFREMLSLKPDSPRELMSEIKSGAARFVDLLPDRLRRSPKWLAAGALAGAFGCAASAALISPIAIAALPSWSAIGAAIAAAMQPAGGGERRNALPADSPDVSDGVRGATLFAVTLELQGRDETTITRVLDEAFPEDENNLSDAHAVKTFLNNVRHRFDQSLASHGLRADEQTTDDS